MKKELTQERLKTLVSYNLDTGIFTWQVHRGGRAIVGAVAGRLNSNGHIQIMIDGTRYLAHRLVWLYINGENPPAQIDHINRIRDDNRLCNLRLATCAENQQNRSKQNNNSSGFPGISWRNDTGEWRVRISCGNVRINVGHYGTLKDAIAARRIAKKTHHTFNPSDTI